MCVENVILQPQHTQKDAMFLTGTVPKNKKYKDTHKEYNKFKPRVPFLRLSLQLRVCSQFISLVIVEALFFPFTV